MRGGERIGRVGDLKKKGKPSKTDTDDPKAQSSKGESIVVLFALDASPNAVLSFGVIRNDVPWSSNESNAALSAGFIESAGVRSGNSAPHVKSDPADKRDMTSRYLISWDLDPGTLANAIDRRNPQITPTARLPRIMKVAIFYDIKMLPFQKNNFGAPDTVLWGHNEREKIEIGPQDMNDMTMAITVNGFDEMQYKYSLKNVYRLNLLDGLDGDIDTGCILLEFEMS